MRTYLSFLVLAVIPILVGCASGSLHDTTNVGSPTTAGVKLSHPGHIYVTPIDVTQGTWKAEGCDLVSLQSKVKNDLESDLVKELAEIAPTSVGSGNDSSGWQLVVTLVHVDPGSATMRELVGLGAGQSKINVTFSLYDHGRHHRHKEDNLPLGAPALARHYLGDVGEFKANISDIPVAFTKALYRQASGGLYSLRFVCAGWIWPHDASLHRVAREAQGFEMAP